MKLNKEIIQFFRKHLLEWFAQSERPMPWKGEKNPYFIWLSEVILQQTRVEQGLPYYEKFCKNFPTVKDLADAPEDEVMKLWEGLGYYSRARNLHTAAQFIAYELGGVFPKRYEDILALKGVGPYTAAAIASFAFNLPYAVLDGNVFRVLARFLGIKQAIDVSAGKKLFAQVAQNLIHPELAGTYNQAIMDFGATHCRPKLPLCSNCILNSKCKAFQNNLVKDLPIKTKKINKKERYFHYLIFNEGNFVYLNKRQTKDIWQNLYEFVLIEDAQLIQDVATMLQNATWITIYDANAMEVTNISKPFRQTLTHQKIIATFWEINLSKKAKLLDENWIKVERKNLNKFAFPKIIDWYLQDKSLYLKLL